MPKETMPESLPAPELATATVTLLSTGRNVVLRELSGRAQMIVDGCAPDGNLLSTLYYRALGSLEEVDGHKLAAAHGKGDLDLIAERLRGREMDELVQAYNANFAAKGTDLKNASSAEA